MTQKEETTMKTFHVVLAITVNIPFLLLFYNFNLPVHLNIHEMEEQKNGTDISQTI